MAKTQGILTHQDDIDRVWRVFNFAREHHLSMKDVRDVLLGSPSPIKDEPLPDDTLARLEYERSDVNSFDYGPYVD